MANEDKENVNHPSHYNWIPGIEALDVCKHFDFVMGNALKYLFRAGHKSSSTKLEDLQKAKWYIEFAIKDCIKDDNINSICEVRGDNDGAV
jgi:hypothetical protein